MVKIRFFSTLRQQAGCFFFFLLACPCACDGEFCLGWLAGLGFSRLPEYGAVRVHVRSAAGAGGQSLQEEATKVKV